MQANERYKARGVSSQKEDVHAAIRNTDKGLFPKAFCKIIPDTLSADPEYALVMHADGAGTKSSLAYVYWKETGDDSVFDEQWLKAMKLIVQTFKEQQRLDGKGPYHFQRTTAWATDGVPLGGYGYPVKPNGLICSMFRPSDDATVFPYLIPSNIFAVNALKQIIEITKSKYNFKNDKDSFTLLYHKALKFYEPLSHLIIQEGIIVLPYYHSNIFLKKLLIKKFITPHVK